MRRVLRTRKNVDKYQFLLKIVALGYNCHPSEQIKPTEEECDYLNIWDYEDDYPWVSIVDRAILKLSHAMAKLDKFNIDISI